MFRVLQHHDCKVVWGYRNEAQQNELFAKGLSKVKFPNSAHNKGLAVDLMPYVCENGKVRGLVDVKTDLDRAKFAYFVGLVMGIAKELGIILVSGIDWDGDGEILSDQTFQDWMHFELKE